MSAERISKDEPRIQAALSDLQDLIRQRWPEASFEVSHGDDPEGIYLGTTVDIADTDEVMDAIIDSLLDIQVEQRLPVYVVPVRPTYRVLEEMRARTKPRRWQRSWS
jgi:hypothetical protein